MKNQTITEIPSITNFFMLFADLDNDKINAELIKSLKRYCKKEKYLFPSINSDHKSFEEKGTGEAQSGSIVIGLFIKV